MVILVKAYLLQISVLEMLIDLISRRASLGICRYAVHCLEEAVGR